jgi:hypothetical protein
MLVLDCYIRYSSFMSVKQLLFRDIKIRLRGLQISPSSDGYTDFLRLEPQNPFVNSKCRAKG